MIAIDRNIEDEFLMSPNMGSWEGVHYPDNLNCIWVYGCPEQGLCPKLYQISLFLFEITLDKGDEVAVFDGFGYNLTEKKKYICMGPPNCISIRQSISVQS